jgi:putative oxidoreductase
MNWLLSSNHLSDKGIAFVRVIVGLLLIIHGTQVFHTDEMNDYGPWLAELGVPLPLFSAYAGKAIELLGGICLITGLFLRLACILLMITFLFISIVMGDGKILTDAQHAFVFFLFALLFFFSGDSGYSIKRFFK